MSKTTPMMQQYFSLKEQYADCILFFRLGDFYEMFADDAELVAPLLDLTLTGRDSRKGERIPMCGVPHHAADGYIAKLVAAGYKVAVCEQIEDPKQAKGVVKRDVVRVVTPGTVTDEKSIDARGNTYLVALCGASQTFGLAACDASTGEFLCTQFSGAQAKNNVLHELARLQPPEILLAPDTVTWGLDKDLQNMFPESLITRYEQSGFSSAATERLQRHLGVTTFAGFGLTEWPLALKASSAVFQYMEETQRVNLRHITTLAPYSPEHKMMLDPATRRNLELTESLRDGSRQGSLLGIMDRCATALGGRLLRRWIEQPETNPQVINERLNTVEAFYRDSIRRSTIREQLARVYDIERLTGRVATGNANGRDMVALRTSLQQLPTIVHTLQTSEHRVLQTLAEQIDPLSDVSHMLQQAIVDEPPISITEGNLIRQGYNEEVDTLRDAQTNGKQWIANLEAQEREKTGIKSLKVGFNRVFGYYIEVTHANAAAVPDHYERKQTLASAERYITPELKEQEALILGAEEKLAQVEYELFTALRDDVARHMERLKAVASVIAKIDVWSTLAHVAMERNYTRPVVNEDDRFHIVEGRHPVVEAGREAEFVPNDVLLDEEQRLIVLTGPNMAGKSTYLRQVALICLLAQIGSYVPARQAQLGIVDRIFTRVGASDDLATGQSTFMVEMTETATICHNATSRSLVLIDELGRGTSTYDGMALAQAVAEYLHDKVNCKTIISTHYHELTLLEDKLERCRNLRVDVAEERGQVIFLYNVVAGGADRSYGINVARMAGIPRNILARAQRLLAEFERNKGGQSDQLLFTDYILASEETAVADDILPTEQDILAELRTISPNGMTPIQALNIISAWQQKLLEADDDLDS